MKDSERFPITNLPEPVSIVMPVYNEAEVIEVVIKEWIKEVFQYLPIGSEFILEDGGSLDGTQEILQSLTRIFPFINIEFRRNKDGFGSAARRLLLRAQCPWVFFTDSDGQYIAKDFWKLARFVNSGYDHIRGAKIGRKDPFPRRLASAIYNKIVRFLFDLNYLDYNSAFYLIKREALMTVIDSVHYMPTLINSELLLRLELENFNIKQVYVMHRERSFGVSRGLMPSQFWRHALVAIVGLYKIKASYRVRS